MTIIDKPESVDTSEVCERAGRCENEKSKQSARSERLFVCGKHRSSKGKNLEDSMNVSEDEIEVPGGLLNKQEASLLKFKIVLDKVIQCPGCSLFLPKEEICAGHLLSECLLPKSRIDSEILRTKFTQWLIRYFQTHLTKSAKNNIKKVTSARETKKRKYSKGALVKVELPYLTFDLQCPICQTYFCSHEVCFQHLFDACLRTRNSSNALSVFKWFLYYLRTDPKSKLDRVPDPNLLQNVGKRCVCNYCKKEFYNRECLLNHFRQSHERVETKDALCSLCNFKPGSEAQLFRHLMKVHVKCGCLEKHKDFDSLKLHLSGCPKSDGCLCPACREVEIRSYETESEFQRHVLNCRKPVPLKYSLHDLYKECDICWRLILKCNVDVHIAGHIKASDAARRQPTNTFVNFSDLEDVLSEKDALKMKKLFE